MRRSSAPSQLHKRNKFSAPFLDEKSEPSRKKPCVDESSKKNENSFGNNLFYFDYLNVELGYKNFEKH